MSACPPPTTPPPLTPQPPHNPTPPPNPPTTPTPPRAALLPSPGTAHPRLLAARAVHRVRLPGAGRRLPAPGRLPGGARPEPHHRRHHRRRVLVRLRLRQPRVRFSPPPPAG